MTASNLSIIFAPSLIRAKNATDMVKIILDANITVQTMIEESDSIFGDLR